MNIENISRFGRSFSILRIPYSLKLLIQELQVMNVQMRIITDQNVDQLVSMSYSDNILELTKNNGDYSIAINSQEIPKELDKISGYAKAYANRLSKSLDKRVVKPDYGEQPYGDYSMQGIESPSETLSLESNSMNFEPYTPEGSIPIEFEPQSPEEPPPAQEEKKIDFGSPELNEFFESLPPKSKASILSLPDRDQLLVLRMTKEKNDKRKMEVVAEVKMPINEPAEILQVEEEKIPEETESADGKSSESKSSEIKSVSFSEPSTSTTSSSSSNLKRVTL
jgi:DNA-directed RNA polymerase II subunit RPB2